jgi:predicted ATPase
MLSLQNDGRYPVLELTPEERRQRTLAALIAQMGALTRQNPVLMIFEDAHSGQRAADRSADEEAVRHLRRGLEMLMSLPDSTDRDRQELEFQLALGTPLAARHGYGSPPVGCALAPSPCVKR